MVVLQRGRRGRGLLLMVAVAAAASLLLLHGHSCSRGRGPLLLVGVLVLGLVLGGHGLRGRRGRGYIGCLYYGCRVSTGRLVWSTSLGDLGWGVGVSWVGGGGWRGEGDDLRRFRGRRTLLVMVMMMVVRVFWLLDDGSSSRDGGGRGCCSSCSRSGLPGLRLRQLQLLLHPWGCCSCSGRSGDCRRAQLLRDGAAAAGGGMAVGADHGCALRRGDGDLPRSEGRRRRRIPRPPCGWPASHSKRGERAGRRGEDRRRPGGVASQAGSGART